MNYQKETERIVNFITDTFKAKGFENAVIGISGGIDSAVIAALCVRALGKEHVYGYGLPCGVQKDINDSRKLAGFLDIKYDEINIKDPVNALVNLCFELAYGPLDSRQGRRGNMASRCRMIVLFDKSAEVNGLVVGTSNRTELMLGYFTSHGDGACALEPIGHLYKTEVFELARYLNIPESLITKDPTAGLWEGQTDEGEIGLTYKEIDNFLQKYNKEYPWIDKYQKLIDIIKKNKFKLEALPMLERE